MYKEFDIDVDSLYNQDYDCTDIDGAVDGTDNRMIAAEHVCIHDRKKVKATERSDTIMMTTTRMMGGRGECCWQQQCQSGDNCSKGIDGSEWGKGRREQKRGGNI